MDTGRKYRTDRRLAFRLPRSGHCVLLAACILSICASLQAGSGEVTYLPAGNLKPKNGLKIVIDHRWLDGNGYRPVRVQLINWPPGPARADRTIRVVLQPNSYRWSRTQQQVSQYIELPQGAARVWTTVAIPQHDLWRSLSVSVYEDGQLCEDLSRDMGIAVRSNEWSEANPSILIIDSDAPSHDDRPQWINQARRSQADRPRRLPDIRFLSRFFPASIHGLESAAAQDEELDDATTLSSLGDLSRIELLPPSALPQRWIDYSCCDMVFISLADLQSLARQHPARWRAIGQWLRSGPVLCVYDMQLSGKQLSLLSALVEVPAGSGQGPADPTSGWQQPKRNTADSSVRALQPLHEHYARYNQVVEDVAESPAGQTPAPGVDGPRPPDSDPFLLRHDGQETVVAVRAAEPFQPGRYGLPWMLNEVGADKWMWYQRHGMSLHRQNASYWDWMIPGVGRAPVGSYLLLISGFVIVIGPLNYFLLRKKKRLYMLLVTVPLGAGLVTAALLNYALIRDGLAVRTRVRSYTQIDQRSGHMASWSRQSYYAGLAPSGGLSYPGDTAVYSIEHFPSERSHRRSMRHLYWDGDQHLIAGYFRSRSTMQSMVVRSAPCRRGLRVVAAEGEDPAPLVTNQLDAQIIELVLTDRAGRCYHARDIQPGARFRPERATSAVARKRIAHKIEAQRPAFPPAYDHRGYGRGMGFGPYYYGGWTDVDPALPVPSFDLGLLERSIQQARSGGGPGWRPGGYIAITETSPDTPLGYASARQEAGFHMIVGQW